MVFIPTFFNSSHLSQIIFFLAVRLLEIGIARNSQGFIRLSYEIRNAVLSVETSLGGFRHAHFSYELLAVL